MKKNNLIQQFFMNPTLLFLLSCFFNSSFIVFSKLLGESFTPYELAFYRILIISIISLIGVFSLYKKFPSFKKINLLIILKSCFALLSMITWFITINNLPIAETVAVSFSTPILSSILAVLILKEKFTTSHFIAFSCGIIGMYIIVSPEFGKMDQYALVGIISCFLLSVSFIIIKFLLQKDYQPIEISYYGNLLMLPMAFFLAYNEISLHKDVNELMLVGSFGLCIFCADFFHNCAYKKGDVTTLMPLLFSTIILGALYDYFIFGTILNARVAIGALIVIVGILVGNFNSYRKKKA